MADIEVRCRECDNDLDAELKANRHGVIYFSIAPCQECLDNAKQEGREDTENEKEEGGDK